MTTETNTSAFAKLLPAAAFLVVPVVLGAIFAVSLGFATPNVAKADGCEPSPCGSGDFEYYDGGYDDFEYYDGGYDDGYDYYDAYDYYDYDYYDYEYYDAYDYYDYDYYDYDYYDDYDYDYYSYDYYDDYDYYYSDYDYDYWEWEFEWEYDYEYEDRDREPKPTCDISASDTSIDEDDSVTLEWDSRYADDASLSGHGDVSLDGSKKVSPNDTTTYRLTVTGIGGKSTCSVTVHVDEEDDDDDDLWCKLDVDDRSVEEGDEVTLEWDTRGAEYASINQGIGRVDEDGGEEDVDIDDDDDVTFRMTVRDDDGDEETCSVTVRVDEEDENDFSSVSFDPGPVNNPPVVYLSDLPYTGEGDMSPSMIGFWGMLTALLGVGAYLVFMKRSKVRA